MALRRGDWETGDVICHECHLTAPLPPPPTHPHLPPHPRLSLSLALRLSTSSSFFFFLSIAARPPLCVYFPHPFAVMIDLNVQAVAIFLHPLVHSCSHLARLPSILPQFRPGPYLHQRRWRHSLPDLSQRTTRSESMK